MPNPIDPGAIWDPGRFSGYGAGRTTMQTVKVHCTAGNDSYGICKNNGLIQWLIPYEGTRWQFAPADALCYDSGPYNTWGPGFEIERPVTGGLIRPGLSEFRDLSASQVEQLHELVHWLADEWGFRLDLYNGLRYQCPSDFGGFVNHGDIESQRSDGVTREEWLRIVGNIPIPVPPDPIPDFSFLFREDDSVFAYTSDEPSSDFPFYKSGMMYEFTPYTIRECPGQAATDTPGCQKVSGATMYAMINARWTVAKALNIPV